MPAQMKVHPIHLQLFTPESGLQTQRNAASACCLDVFQLCGISLWGQHLHHCLLFESKPKTDSSCPAFVLMSDCHTVYERFCSLSLPPFLFPSLPPPLFLSLSFSLSFCRGIGINQRWVTPSAILHFFFLKVRSLTEHIAHWFG